MNITKKSFATRDDWLIGRKFGIGASESACILGLSKWGTPLSIFLDKRSEFFPEDDQSEYQEWGHRLEGPIGLKFEEATGRTVFLSDPTKPDIFFPDDYPFIFATPDGFQSDGVRERGVLEIKNVSVNAFDEWDDGIPLFYQIQLQHQMLCTNTQWGSMAALFGGNHFECADVLRHERFIQSVLIPQLVEFWTQIEEGIVPEADGHARTGTLLSRFYKEVADEIVELEGDFVQLDHRLEDVTAELKKAENEKATIQNKIKMALGNATRGILPTGVHYTWRPNKHGARSFRRTASKE